MKNKILIIVTVILTIAAAGIWYFVVFAVEPVDTGPTQSNNTNLEEQKQTTSESKYATLKGDAFDEAYVTDMIAHTDGALNMSEQAGALTTREEIRAFAGNILQNQGRQLMQLHTWRNEWNYKAAPSNGHLNHGGGGLEGLTGAAYDEEFLKQMIIHHEQAIEMSQFASTNARHQEIKDLASTIINTQTAEIEQMKQWQEEWGY